MKKARNKERILSTSIELFNQSGVVAVTTNHIAAHLEISPGNLYFHFRNKEEIIRELFDRMCTDTYGLWVPNKTVGTHDSPLALIERTLEVYWTYRFFHREMYHLRRKDPLMARKWKRHINKMARLLLATYGHWVKKGVLRKLDDPKEMQMIADIILGTSSWFFQFFESPEKPATRKSVKTGVDHILRFLLPYHTEKGQKEILSRLGG